MIVLLNGPRGIGKDTIAALMRDMHGWCKTEFKHALYEETSKQFNIPVEVLRERNESRELKELPFEYKGLQFKPVRQLLIYTSEHVIKPKYGRDFFGLKAAALVKYFRATELVGKMPVVFSDSGFEEERLALMDSLYEPIVTVKLIREGYRFSSDTDSRQYLSNPDLTIKLVEGQAEVAMNQILTYLHERYGHYTEE